MTNDKMANDNWKIGIFLHRRLPTPEGSGTMPTSLRITVAGQWRLLTAFPVRRSRLANSKLLLCLNSREL